MAVKKCPVCGVSVKVENLERHVGNQHPRERLEPEQLLTTEERQDVRRATPASRPAMTRRGKLSAAAVAVILVVVIVALAFRPNIGIGPGQVAPDFTATTSDGGTVHLNALRGQPVFLAFMDIDCLHCINEARDVLPILYQDYSARVNFLSVDVDFPSLPPTDTRDRINVFRTQYQNTWPFALPDPLITQAYGVSGTPTMYVLDRNGVVVQRFAGETSYADVSVALNRALQA
jgi:cytochrome oxidase Cu insertion factor (SCO1/SenC/PrrC family)